MVVKPDCRVLSESVLTWGRYDDRAPFHRKWLTLSNDAVALFWRANQWARSPEAKACPGFVTERELLALRGDMSIPRCREVIVELLDAGKPAHEHGLLEPVEDGGFMIHDFDDHGPPGAAPSAPPPVRSRAEAARIAGLASAQKRRERNGTAQPVRPGAKAPERPSNDSLERPRTIAPNVPERPGPDPEPIPERNLSNVRTIAPNVPERRSVERPSNDAPNESIEERCRAIVEKPHLAHYQDVHRWPPLVDFYERYQRAMSLSDSPLQPYGRDSITRALVEVFAQCGADDRERILALAPRDPYIKERRLKGIAALTAQTIRNLLARGREEEAEQAKVDELVELAARPRPPARAAAPLGSLLAGVMPEPEEEAADAAR